MTQGEILLATWIGERIYRMITDKFYGDKPEDIEDIMKGIILYNKMHGFGCSGRGTR